jgi:hypothetical protein
MPTHELYVHQGPDTQAEEGGGGGEGGGGRAATTRQKTKTKRMVYGGGAETDKVKRMRVPLRRKLMQILEPVEDQITAFVWCFSP